MIKELAEAIKTFTPQHWGVMAAIIAGTMSSWLWLNKTFAQRESTEQMLELIITINSNLHGVISTQYTEDEKKAIDKSAAEYEKILRLYLKSLKNK